MGKSLGFALAIVLGCVSIGQAAPLDLKQVSADAKWAVHVDFDALHASGLFQKAWKQLTEKHPEAEVHLAMAKTMWNFDPRTDLHGVTIFGTQFKRDTGVALINAKVDQARLIEFAKNAPDHRTSNYGKYEIHSWLHAKGSRHERTFAGVMVKPEVILFGASAEEVMAALDVLDGKKPNAAEKTTTLVGSIPSGAIMVAGAIGLASVDLPFHCPVAKLADSFVLAVGENKNEVFVQGHLMVKDAATAQQIKTVADGVIALASLAHHDDAEILKLIGTVKVSSDDKAVNLDGRAPVDAVWSAAEKAVKQACQGFGHRFGGHEMAPSPRGKKK
jgi:hypothetical protein